MHRAFLDELDTLISTSRIAAVVAGEIEAAPALLARLRAELSTITGQIETARRNLANERISFDNWRRRATESEDLDQTTREVELRDAIREVTRARERLLAVHNEIAAKTKQFDALILEYKRLERQQR